MLQVAIMAMSLANAGPTPESVGARFESWEQRIRSRIAELHVVPEYAAKDDACDVSISFAIGKDGRPTAPTIRETSCPSYYDRAALRLVRHLGRVGAVPSADGNDHAVVLKLSYGVPPTAAADRQLNESLEKERSHYADRNLRIVTTPLRTASAGR